jgi:hypothetical protein
LIGYKGRFVGNIFFDGNKARITLRSLLSSLLSDSSQGFQYVLYNNDLKGDAFVYKYNSHINFKQVSLLDSVYSDFDIPTPPEVIGTINIDGTRASGNLKAILLWNADPDTKMIIDIGASPINKINVIPIYQIKTKDDGRFVVPADLLNSIPPKKFDKLYISFVRQLKTNHKDNNGSNLTIFSQSVHTIIIEGR